MQTQSADHAKKVIYDIGANNGDDIPYYLLKADRVVAVEANADLCAIIAEKNRQHLDDGRLIILNCAVMARKDRTGASIDFYLHDSHVLSTLVKPKAHLASHYRKVDVVAMTLDELFAEHGAPWFIKVDIEGYDAELVADLFSLAEFPDYLACEIHSKRAAQQLLDCDAFSGFKLVEGAHVQRDYGEASIATQNGRQTFAFPAHAAGPFGEDISGPWYDRASMERLIRVKGYGWRDLHASRHSTGELVEVAMPRFNPLTSAVKKLIQLIPGRIRGKFGL